MQLFTIQRVYTDRNEKFLESNNAINNANSLKTLTGSISVDWEYSKFNNRLMCLIDDAEVIDVVLCQKSTFNLILFKN